MTCTEPRSLFVFLLILDKLAKMQNLITNVTRVFYQHTIRINIFSQISVSHERPLRRV